MSTSCATNVRRWTPNSHNGQARTAGLLDSARLREQAGRAVSDAFPPGTKLMPHFIPSKMTHMREGLGGLGDVALLLWLARDRAAERRVMGFLEGLLAAKYATEDADLVADLVELRVKDSEDDIAQAELLAAPGEEGAQDAWMAKAEEAAWASLEVIGRIRRARMGR